MVSVLDGSRVLLKILRNPEAVFFIPNSSVDQGDLMIPELTLFFFFPFNGGFKFFWWWKISNINVGIISIMVCIPIASNCQLMAELFFFLIDWLIDWLISRAYRFSICGDTWNIPRPGIKRVSLALADRFLTTGLPGKLLSLFLLYE